MVSGRDAYCVVASSAPSWVSVPWKSRFLVPGAARCRVRPVGYLPLWMGSLTHYLRAWSSVTDIYNVVDSAERTLSKLLVKAF
jgi:hypothetical protein